MSDRFALAMSLVALSIATLESEVVCAIPLTAFGMWRLTRSDQPVPSA